MAKRPKKNDIPAKTQKKTQVFQGGSTKSEYAPHVRAFNHKNGTPHSGLTMNRQKPGGGHGSAGPTKSVG